MCSRSRRNATTVSSGSSGSDWRSKCRQLLDIIWNHVDSEPFREPVDTIEHPGILKFVHCDCRLFRKTLYLT